MEAGIAAYKAKYPERNDTFDTTWKPFYLNPDAPKSIDKQTYAALTSGSLYGTNLR